MSELAADATTPSSIDAPVRATARFQPGVAATAALFGVVAGLLGVAASWVPSLWTDEVATLNAISRPWGELWSLLSRVDAVHGAYYIAIKPWIDVVGTAPFALRLPSAVAAGLAVAGTVVLMWMLVGRAHAICVGVFMCVLPATLGMAIEARSGAFVTATAVWAGVFLVLALRGRRVWWVAYAGALVLTGAFFVLALSLVAAHAVTMAWSIRRRSAWLAWSLSVAASIAVIAPLALLASRQSAQIDWVQSPTLVYVAGTFAAASWFGESLLVGFAMWVLIALSLWRRRTPQGWDGRPSVVSLALPWLLVPGLALLIGSFVLSPMFVARYLVYCAPAAALLAACGVFALTRWMRIVAVVIVVAVCVPVAVLQRTEFAKDGSDWSAAAAEVEVLAAPGDPVIFISDGGQPRSPRRALEAYPAQFEALDDVGLVSTPRENGGLWGIGTDLESSAALVVDRGQGWALVSRISIGGSIDEAHTRFADAGLDAELVWEGPSTLIFALAPAQ